MIVAAISDLHGHLPKIPPCDLLIIAGDLAPCHRPLDESIWLAHTFLPWLEQQPAKKVIGVWGNHDFIGEKAPHLVPRMPMEILTDRLVTYDGLRIYGTPWQPRFLDWAFNLDEPDLSRKWDNIPDDTDILVLHGPPHGHCDLANPNTHRPYPEHTGSPSLTQRISKIQPRLVICGHIHEAHGISHVGQSLVANVSHVNEDYRPMHSPMIFNMHEDGSIS